jgi:hypothetical protein
MAKLPIDFSKFKKVRSHEGITTLKHEQGHEIHISTKALSPKHRAALEALPIHSNNKSLEPIQAFAEGGLTKNLDPDKVKAFQSGSMFNAKGKKEVAAAPDVKKVDYGSDSNDYDAGGPVKRMAEGGAVESENSDKSHQPVVINIGSQQPQLPDSMINPEAIAKSQPKVDTPQATDPGSLPYGVSPEDIQKGATQAPQMQQMPQVQAAQPQMQAGQAPQAQPAIAAQQQDPFGTQAFGNAYAQGVGEQKAGIAQQAQAEQQQGRADEMATAQAAEQQHQALKTFQQHSDELNNERQSLIQDINSQHIDPDRYVNNMSTGDKMGTAIGLLLSGMGSGILHQENPVMKFMQQQIDNDIQAQKADLGKKENLLSANFKQFGNMRDATDMTKVMTNDILSAQLKQSAAKATSTMARANALKAAGVLDQQSAPIMSQIAARKTLLGGVGAGKINPGAAVKMLVPEGQQEKVFGELAQAQGMTRAKDNILNAFDKLTQTNTLGNRVSSPIQSGRQVNAIKDPLIAGLSKETAGRFTEQDSHMLETLFPAPGDSTDTLNEKRTRINNLISEKMNFPQLDFYGINPNQTGRYNAQGMNKIKESAPISRKK